jgi:hypothetical protein
VSAGTFYLAANCSADYTHCGARRGRTLFYWPADKTARSAPVVPRLFSLIEIRGARHVVLSNLTFRDTSYWSGGAWHNTGSTVRKRVCLFANAIILPRQARDKHTTRESTQKRTRFCRGRTDQQTGRL